MFTPQQVDEAIGRDDLADMHEQDRQQGSLLGRPELGGGPIRYRLERTKDPKVHRPHIPVLSLDPVIVRPTVARPSLWPL
jgi:hypothetical protein